MEWQRSPNRAVAYLMYMLYNDEEIVKAAVKDKIKMEDLPNDFRMELLKSKYFVLHNTCICT